MGSGYDRSSISAMQKQERLDQLIKILDENRNGLTAAQIGRFMGSRVARNLLMELRKEGKVRKKRGYSSDGRVSFIYVLNRDADRTEEKIDPSKRH